ncbi:hypothetical protein PN419_00415 [Halorubrum ezzemoulense]|uniref:hypothetical protein n=1 Tax=Halorubrum ezzemoulense TaxID=337243 RepID=UPI00233011EC|nr:hypothetical protein [Halorubrum ezzemoulense]MDB9247470.1 hypothetical protein [Halorubrum ezzemoulense]MDB9258621.1 hypothetical protein [Halorubrum ezzemoulense]MDB9264521.1 hypothetical protein [Halorubrum ezzemoulense]MDB9268982.1 hypothetical protein [Halorubrum ezzemoulense]MDB9271489.1 hypothetical protein [Halorubrum ezzemoulense]
MVAQDTMPSDESSQGSTVGATDDRPAQPSEMTWARIDYRAARPSDSEWQDRGTPTGIPESMVGQTTIDATDAPPEARRQYEWLDDLNDGVGDSDRRGEIHRAGIARDLGVVASHLRLTDHQHDRAQWLLDRLDLKDDVIPSGTVELAVIAVVSLVVDEDRTRLGAPRDTQSVLRDDAFNELCAEFEVDKSRVKNVRQRVRETDVYESPNK